MALSSGVRLGAYEILSAAGAGGMGQVYKARDTRLDRTVAVKILPDAVAADSQSRERFDREAHAISRLTHPHICVLYDVGHQDGIDFLVMEYLEGETLEHRLTKGALPLTQALQYAIEIAGALDHAHSAGIVHRDLKPANIVITKSGAKLLDFGLAKATAPVGTDAGFSMAATKPPGLTVQGTIVGTFQYMSPEQIEGNAADARTDIFAFGAVLYEMVTGRKAFEGKSQASLISAILERDPPAISTVQPLAPRTLERLVQKCLAKDPAQRWQTIRDVRDELKWIAEDGTAAAATTTTPGSGVARRARLPWALFGVSLVTLVVASMALLWNNPSPIPTGAETRVELPLPAGVSLSNTPSAVTPVASPDGRRIVFVGNRVGVNQLWVRPLEQFEAQLLTGTEGAFAPFWSPDSRKVGFFAGNRLKTVDVEVAGLVKDISEAVGPVRGGTWSQAGVIVFGSATGLHHVSDVGGTPSPLTIPDASSNEVFHAGPYFLPDGQHFLYRAMPSNTNWVGKLGGKERTQLPPADTVAVYGGPGHLFFVRQGTLMAQPFNTATLSVSGEALPVGAQVLRPLESTVAAFSVSHNGVLVYRPPNPATPSQLTWFDRAGTPLRVVGPPDLYRNPVLSPEGTRLAVEKTDPSTRTQDIWLIDLASGGESRFTFDRHDDVLPVWSPNGTRIVFGSNRDGLFSLYEKPANRERGEELVFKSSQDHVPYSWSTDDKIVFRTFAGTRRAIGIFSMSDRKPQLYEEPQAQQLVVELAPNGQWVLYSSVGGGDRNEIFVDSFPKPIRKWQISTQGSAYGRWGKTTGEIFYYAADSRIIAVPITDERTLQPGVAEPLFKVDMAIGPLMTIANFRQQYDVSRDGKQFLVNVGSNPAAPAQLKVILNWTTPSAASGAARP